jgi:trans-2,3-dihydro-3-hydroxyanthranilate isomerase
MPSYPYLHLDVFTDTRFAGNQLAVFSDARGLSSERMQQMATEIAFSESTFVLPAEVEGTDVRMRIFTPARELPMAGHPTVGSTFALAADGVIRTGQRRFVFGLGIGPTPVALEWQGERLTFVWMTQQPPAFGPRLTDTRAVAAAVGLDEDAIVRDLPVEEISCGVPFVFVPIASRRAIDEAVADRRAIASLFSSHGLPERGLFLFSTGPGGDGADAYSRMFAPGLGVAEDPATGSASGPLGCYLLRYGVVSPERAARLLSLQGVKMGRPSRVHIRIAADAGGAITAVQVGGESVLVGRGVIEIE